MIEERLLALEHTNILKKDLADYVVTMYSGKPYVPSDIGSIEVVFVQSPLDDGQKDWPIAYLLREIGFC